MSEKTNKNDFPEHIDKDNLQSNDIFLEKTPKQFLSNIIVSETYVAPKEDSSEQEFWDEQSQDFSENDYTYTYTYTYTYKDEDFPMDVPVIKPNYEIMKNKKKMKKIKKISIIFFIFFIFFVFGVGWLIGGFSKSAI